MSVKRVTMHEVTCDACVAEEELAGVEAADLTIAVKPFVTLAEHPRFRHTLGHKSFDLCQGHASRARNEPDVIAALLTPPKPEPKAPLEPLPEGE